MPHEQGSISKRTSAIAAAATRNLVSPPSASRVHDISVERHDDHLNRSGSPEGCSRRLRRPSRRGFAAGLPLAALLGAASLSLACSDVAVPTAAPRDATADLFAGAVTVRAMVPGLGREIPATSVRLGVHARGGRLQIDTATLGSVFAPPNFDKGGQPNAHSTFRRGAVRRFTATKDGHTYELASLQDADNPGRPAAAHIIFQDGVAVGAIFIRHARGSKGWRATHATALRLDKLGTYTSRVEIDFDAQQTAHLALPDAFRGAVAAVGATLARYVLPDVARADDLSCAAQAAALAAATAAFAIASYELGRDTTACEALDLAACARLVTDAVKVAAATIAVVAAAIALYDCLAAAQQTPTSTSGGGGNTGGTYTYYDPQFYDCTADGTDCIGPSPAQT